MLSRHRQSAGFSLIELLMVIAVLGILVGLALPNSDPGLHEQLRAVSRIFSTDLAYARSLALANNSTYRVTFDTENNRYLLEHSGSNVVLDQLPDSPFREPEDPPDQHIVDVDELPHMGPRVRLATVAQFGASPQRVSSVEFGPLGETTRSAPTVIWLAAGPDSDARYFVLTVDPITGLVDIGDYTTNGPPSALLP